MTATHATCHRTNPSEFASITSFTISEEPSIWLLVYNNGYSENYILIKMPKTRYDKSKVKIKGEVKVQDHNSLSSIQLMHFRFISRQLEDHPFLRYDQYSVWPWKTHSKHLGKNIVNQCHRNILGSRSRLGHQVHSAKPIITLFQKYNGFDWRRKSRCGGGGHGGGGNELKT